MTNIRMKIAAAATAIGLGGLAGFALTSGGETPATTTAKPVAEQPRVRTQVIRRTIHVPPKHQSNAAGASPHPSDTSASAPAPAPAPAPAAAPPPPPTTTAAAAIPVSAPPPAPAPEPTTRTSGGGGSAGDDGGEHEVERESGEEGDD